MQDLFGLRHSSSGAAADGDDLSGQRHATELVRVAAETVRRLIVLVPGATAPD